LIERAQFHAEIERLVSSHTLHGSESLCKLLRYLGRHAVEHPGVPVKEYQIATEVFGRQADFDPQLDSMVRVQAGRLRWPSTTAQRAPATGSLSNCQKGATPSLFTSGRLWERRPVTARRL